MGVEMIFVTSWKIFKLEKFEVVGPKTNTIDACCASVLEETLSHN